MLCLLTYLCDITKKLERLILFFEEKGINFVIAVVITLKHSVQLKFAKYSFNLSPVSRSEKPQNAFLCLRWFGRRRKLESDVVYWSNMDSKIVLLFVLIFGNSFIWLIFFFKLPSNIVHIGIKEYIFEIQSKKTFFSKKYLKFPEVIIPVKYTCGFQLKFRTEFQTLIHRIYSQVIQIFNIWWRLYFNIPLGNRQLYIIIQQQTHLLRGKRARAVCTL